MEQLIGAGFALVCALILWKRYKRFTSNETKNFLLITELLDKHFPWTDENGLEEIRDIFFILERQIELIPVQFCVERLANGTYHQWIYQYHKGKVKQLRHESSQEKKDILVKNHKNKGVYEDIECIVTITFDVPENGNYYFSVQFPSEDYPLFVFAKSHTAKKLRGLTRDEFVETVCKKLGYA